MPPPSPKRLLISFRGRVLSFHQTDAGPQPPLRLALLCFRFRSVSEFLESYPGCWEISPFRNIIVARSTQDQDILVTHLYRSGNPDNPQYDVTKWDSGFAAKQF